MSWRSGARLVALAVLTASAVIALAAGPTLLHRYGDRLFSTSRCTVTIEGASSTLTAEQTNNAALIATTALRRGLPAHAVTVALATALQESDLRNLDYGDRDSLGLFQQRPSQGWGSAEQVRDPRFAADSFYDELERVPEWETIPVAEAAQAVQRSGHPLGYANHEADARLWARVLTGEAPPSSLTCSLSGPKADPDVSASFANRATEDWGSRAVVAIAPSDGLVASVQISSSDPSIVDAATAWAIAVAGDWPVENVTLCNARWTRQNGAWGDIEGASQECEGGLTVGLRTG